VNALEFSILRSVAANLRRVLTHIKRGDLGHAFLLFSNARHELGLGAGLMATQPGDRAPSWERLANAVHRVETQLLGAITRAIQQPRLADPRELAAEIAEGLRVLQTRDGVDISEEQVLDRARNLACGLFGNHVISEPNDSGFHVGPTRIHNTQVCDPGGQQIPRNGRA
jgi:hypothetical protein